MEQSSWLEIFEETCQNIMEDTLLLDALSMYMLCGGTLSRSEREEYFPQSLRRLCDYLVQHALELRRLEKRFGPSPAERPGP